MFTPNHYLNVCVETWAHCEGLLFALSHKNTSYSKRTVQVLDECAGICLGTMELLKAGCQNLSQMALLCVGLCEECAEVCERYTDDQFKRCAEVCRQCSAMFSQLASETA